MHSDKISHTSSTNASINRWMSLQNPKSMKDGTGQLVNPAHRLDTKDTPPMQVERYQLLELIKADSRDGKMYAYILRRNDIHSTSLSTSEAAGVSVKPVHHLW